MVNGQNLTCPLPFGANWRPIWRQESALLGVPSKMTGFDQNSASPAHLRIGMWPFGWIKASFEGRRVLFLAKHCKLAGFGQNQSFCMVRPIKHSLVFIWGVNWPQKAVCRSNFGHLPFFMWPVYSQFDSRVGSRCKVVAQSGPLASKVNVQCQMARSKSFKEQSGHLWVHILTSSMHGEANQLTIQF